MKNSDLIVQNSPAKELNILSFTKAEDMTSWEFDAYDSYDELHGEGACEKDKIDTMADMFGQEFSDAFFTHKYTLRAQSSLEVVNQQIRQLEEGKAKIEVFLKNPHPVNDPNDIPFPTYYPDETSEMVFDDES